MSTKKKVVIFISFFIVAVALVFVTMRNNKDQRIKEQQRLITEKRVLDEKRELYKEQRKHEEEQKVREEERIGHELYKLEKKFDKSTGYFNDDEDELKNIKRGAEALNREKYSTKFRYRIERLIGKCEDQL